jgi:Spy/CpxP family protein refolding chaperone
MKKLTSTLVITIVSFFLLAGASMAQHSEHHQRQKADSTKTLHQIKKMPMQQRMMGMMGEGMMSRGMMGMGERHPGMMGFGMMHGDMMAGHDPLLMEFRNFGCPGFLLEAADQLELTETQIEKLKTLRDDFKKLAIQKRSAIDIAQVDLKAQLDASKPDFNVAKAKVKEINDGELELRLAFLEKIEQGRALLTAEQLEKFKELPKSCCHGGHGMMK